MALRIWRSTSLDNLDPSNADAFERDAGVKNTYLGIEYRKAQIDDFGNAQSLRVGGQSDSLVCISTFDEESSERRVGFLVEYDGTDFFGWQDQGPTLPSIQGTIETVVSNFSDNAPQIIGSSRTDAGVHAQAQVAAFSFMHPIEVKRLEKVLNRRLPPTISVKKMRLVAPLFFLGMPSAEDLPLPSVF